jgi:hypothetical protein
MAQVGYTPIQLYYSSTTTNAPVAGNLAYGELAINITDGKLFYKDNANAIQVIGWKVTPATAGGTGQTSYAVGDLLYANTTTTLAKLADVATGNALISGGVSTAPSWGKIGLTTHVSGTLPTANGGTNLTSFTANGVVYASSTSALATGSALTFDGTKFTQTASTTAAGGLAEFKNTATNAQTGNITATNDAGTSLKVIVFGSAAGSYGTLTANSPMIYTAASELNLVANNASGVIKFGVGSTPNLMSSIDVNGNYIPAIAGKGINFTANTPAAGMTSQLLNWYEEGDWTPTYSPASGSFTSVTYNTNTYGRYTRIGRMVSIQGIIITDAITVGTAAGNIRIAGLPFSSAKDTTVGVGYATNFNVNNPSGGFVSGSLLFPTYRLTSNGATSISTVSDLSVVGTFQNYLIFSATYVV